MSESKGLDWLEFESPWECQPGKVRVKQSAECVSRDELSKRARRNELTGPYIFESPHERRLHFCRWQTPISIPARHAS